MDFRFCAVCAGLCLAFARPVADRGAAGFRFVLRGLGPAESGRVRLSSMSMSKPKSMGELVWEPGAVLGWEV